MNYTMKNCERSEIKGFKSCRHESSIGGNILGDCELCGAMKVGVRSVRTGKTEVTACSRCVEKMNLAPKSTAPGLVRARQMSTRPAPKSKRNQFMNRPEKDLADDFAQRISKARMNRNWSQQQLGQRMAETVNVVKAAEGGKHPTDAVIKKFERILNITLMVDHAPSETRKLDGGPARGMTFGDFLDDKR